MRIPGSHPLVMQLIDQLGVRRRRFPPRRRRRRGQGRQQRLAARQRRPRAPLRVRQGTPQDQPLLRRPPRALGHALLDHPAPRPGPRTRRVQHRRRGRQAGRQADARAGQGLGAGRTEVRRLVDVPLPDRGGRLRRADHRPDRHPGEPHLTAAALLHPQLHQPVPDQPRHRVLEAGRRHRDPPGRAAEAGGRRPAPRPARDAHRVLGPRPSRRRRHLPRRRQGPARLDRHRLRGTRRQGRARAAHRGPRDRHGAVLGAQAGAGQPPDVVQEAACGRRAALRQRDQGAARIRPALVGVHREGLEAGARRRTARALRRLPQGQGAGRRQPARRPPLRPGRPHQRRPARPPPRANRLRSARAGAPPSPPTAGAPATSPRRRTSTAAGRSPTTPTAS